MSSRSIEVKVCRFHLVKRQQSGVEGVKNRRFWDDIVYGRPPIVTRKKRRATLFGPTFLTLSIIMVYRIFIHNTHHRAATANFWHVRQPQWRPHQWRATSAAPTFYPSKSRQGLGLGGLTSHGLLCIIRSFQALQRWIFFKRNQNYSVMKLFQCCMFTFVINH